MAASIVPAIVPFRLPSSRINWTNSAFLMGTAFLTCTAVPYYLWRFGVDWFQVSMFLGFFIATGLSITLGYHRLFAHKAFEARSPVRLLTLLFGAAAFENSVMAWVSDHRRHHKHVDSDNDPYDISKGFWHAHIGWILFRLEPEPPWDNITDLRRDRLVVLQEQYYVLIAVTVGFVVPMILGYLHAGWLGALGGLLLAGVARVVAVQHMTFFINSLCHTLGRQPYSDRCSARDSALMAIFTFGEGYHNYHHEFQHDYRNGVKWWQWDPTKWTIWTLAKLGLASDLRRVTEEKVLLFQLVEVRRRLEERLACQVSPLSTRTRQLLQDSRTKLHQLGDRWTVLKAEYAEKTDVQIVHARAALAEIRAEIRLAFELLDQASAMPA